MYLGWSVSVEWFTLVCVFNYLHSSLRLYVNIIYIFILYSFGYIFVIHKRLYILFSNLLWLLCYDLIAQIPDENVKVTDAHCLKIIFSVCSVSGGKGDIFKSHIWRSYHGKRVKKPRDEPSYNVRGPFYDIESGSIQEICMPPPRHCTVMILIFKINVYLATSSRKRILKHFLIIAENLCTRSTYANIYICVCVFVHVVVSLVKRSTTDAAIRIVVI